MQPLLHIGFSIFLYMNLFYVASLVLKDASIVDIAWGIGFIVIACVAIVSEGANPTLVLMTAAVCVWALRLSGHILRRKFKEPGEDFRYAQWRKDWGTTFLVRSYLQVFMLQGVIMLCISLPIIGIAYVSPNAIHPLSLIGFLVWAAGFIFESIADEQLSRFKKNKSNKGKLMTQGLWKYSRHPNYFGESVQWWGVWIMAMVSTSLWWTIVSPLLITYFLRFVSGVPMLERKYEGRQDFEAYKKTTNAFVPWFSHARS